MQINLSPLSHPAKQRSPPLMGESGIIKGYGGNFILFLSPRRFELLQISHQEIILPLNYRLSITIFKLKLR
jgi:hypothetical protein